jgi:integrase
MANRTADILGQMFKFGIHRSIVEDSPVKLLYKPGGKEKHGKRVLNEKEQIAFVQSLHKACRSQRKRHILMLLLLTLQRRSELGLAEWREFDFARKTWHIPDAHSKNRRGHIVPLTDWAIAELKALQDLAKGSRFVLPSNKPDRPANPKLITRSVARSLDRFKKIGIDAFRAHDLRRTGRTELARLGVQKHIAERVLNHSKEDIEGTYDLYEYLDEKRVALERWERRLLELKRMTQEEIASSVPNKRSKRGTRQRSRRMRSSQRVQHGPHPNEATNSMSSHNDLTVRP